MLANNITQSTQKAEVKTEDAPMITGYDHDYLNKCLLEFERDYPVADIVINDIKIWPYMKVSMLHKLQSHFYVNKGKIRASHQQKPVKEKLINLGKTLLNGLKLTAKTLSTFPFKHYFSRHAVNTVMFAYNTKSLDVGPRRINRYLVGVVDDYERLGHSDYEIWEYNSLDAVDDKATFAGVNMTYLSATVNEWCKCRIALSSLFPQKETDYVEAFNRFLTHKGIPVQLESYKLRHEIKRIDFMSRLLQPFFERHQVKNVINICYYGYLAIAANLACYRAGIKSVDYQHGILTRVDPFYTHWSHVPDSGYALLPKTFWVWGDVGYDIVNEWIAKQSFHQVKVVGNAWLSYFSNTSKASSQIDGSQIKDSQIKTEQIDGSQTSGSHLSDLASPSFKSTSEPSSDLSSELSLKQSLQLSLKSKKVILLSLQTFPQDYPNFVTQVIHDSPDDWVFIIKEHPRYHLTQTQLSDEFGELLDAGKVVLMRDYSVYELLVQFPIDVNLTPYSTVAFECEYFGVPTVFFHEVGIKGNMALIRTTPHLMGALDADSLMENIKIALALEQIEPVYMAKQVTIGSAMREENAN